MANCLRKARALFTLSTGDAACVGRTEAQKLWEGKKATKKVRRLRHYTPLTSWLQSSALFFFSIWWIARVDYVTLVECEMCYGRRPRWRHTRVTARAPWLEVAQLTTRPEPLTTFTRNVTVWRICINIPYCVQRCGLQGFCSNWYAMIWPIHAFCKKAGFYR